MYLVETLIANAQKQIELAPSLEENPDPGANWTPRGNPDSDVRPNMVSKCVDGLNRAGDVPILKAVEFGKTRYENAFDDALKKAKAIAEIFTKVRMVQNAGYADGEQRQKALARFSGESKKIKELCEAFIADMKVALGVLHEGEGRSARDAGKNPVGAK